MMQQHPPPIVKKIAKFQKDNESVDKATEVPPTNIALISMLCQSKFFH
jgi:hypothetical protein